MSEISNISANQLRALSPRTLASKESVGSLCSTTKSAETQQVEKELRKIEEGLALMSELRGEFEKAYESLLPPV